MISFKSLTTVIIACLLGQHLLATSRPPSQKEARDIKLAIEASLRQAEIDKKRADAELKQALAESKKPEPKVGPSKPMTQMSEQEQLKRAIELSKKASLEEKKAQELKLSAAVGEREKENIVDHLEFIEGSLQPHAELLSELVEIQDILKMLKSKPYTVSTLQSAASRLKKISPTLSEEMDIDNTYLERKIGYEIDRLNGKPGVSFRDYYKKHMADVDAQIRTGTLNLSNLNLVDLTDFDQRHVPHLHAITSLILSDNKLTQIPESIGEFVALQDLSLDSNYLTKIPASIDQLIGLIRLHLHTNKLSDLPASLGNLGAYRQLRHLCIDNNEFTQIPAAVQYLLSLHEFDANDNKIAVIPDWIGNLVELVALDLSNNRISILPEGMSKLINLQQLFLVNNRIVVVPDWIGNLAALVELDFNDNRISHLPETIASTSEEKPRELIHLQGLYLSGNDFTSPPEGLNRLPALERLGLRNNPLTETQAQLKKELGLRDNISFLYKTPEQEKVENELIDAIKEGNVDAVRKSFTAIMAGRIMIGPDHDEKIDISKIRDANGDNLLQIVLKALVNKKAEINKKKMDPKEKSEALFDAEVPYTKIYMTLTQFGGPKVQEMMLARNKAGQDLFQAALGILKPESFFVQTLREYRFKPGTEKRHAERFRIMRRHNEEKKEAEEVAKEQVAQREHLKPSVSSAVPSKL